MRSVKKTSDASPGKGARRDNHHRVEREIRRRGEGGGGSGKGGGEGNVVGGKRDEWRVDGV